MNEWMNKYEYLGGYNFSTRGVNYTAEIAIIWLLRQRNRFLLHPSCERLQAQGISLASYVTYQRRKNPHHSPSWTFSEHGADVFHHVEKVDNRSQKSAVPPSKFQI